MWPFIVRSHETQVQGIVVKNILNWKVYDGTKLQSLKEIKDEKSLICALNTFDSQLVSGSLESLKIYETQHFNLVKTVGLPGRMVYAIVVYSNYILIANDNSIYILDSKSYQIISKLHGGHCAQITGLCIAKSNLGDKLFSASRDRTLMAKFLFNYFKFIIPVQRTLNSNLGMESWTFDMFSNFAKTRWLY